MPVLCSFVFFVYSSLILYVYSAVSSCEAVSHHYKHVYVFKLLRLLVLNFERSLFDWLLARSCLLLFCLFVGSLCAVTSCEAVSHQYNHVYVFKLLRMLLLNIERSFSDCSIASSLVLFVGRSSLVLYVLWVLVRLCMCSNCIVLLRM